MKQVSGLFRSVDMPADPAANTFSDERISVWILGTIFLPKIDDNPCNNPAEYLANLYFKSGTDGFRLLDGRFLTIIRVDGKTLFYRDRFGSGPQLYFNATGFATNPAELMKATKMSPEPDPDALSGFLQFGYIPSPLCGLAHVQKLPGGVLGTWEGVEMKLSPLFSWEDLIRKGQTAHLSENEAVERYKELHIQSIKRMIQGAGTVGVLLSGGYDSAGNIAALSEVYSGKVEAYTVGFKDNNWSEVPQARLMADKIGASFNSCEIDGSEIMDLPLLVRQFGDPFQEGGLMVNFAAMKLASKFQPDVVLGGDGNDQYHGTSAKELAMHSLLRQTGMSIAQRMFRAYGSSKSTIQDDRLFRYSFHNSKILNILSMDEFGFSNGELAAMGLKGTSRIDYGISKTIPTARTFDELFLQRQYFVDVRQVINEVILFKAGQNAELWGLNLAFPYMDRDLTAFLDGLPRDFRFSGSFTELIKGRGTSKYLHCKSYAAAMPPELSTKKKQGGFAPLSIFFKSDSTLNLVEKIILQSDIKSLGLNMSWIAKFITHYKKERLGQPNWFWYAQLQAFRLFNLLVLAVWWEMVIKGRDIQTLDELV